MNWHFLLRDVIELSNAALALLNAGRLEEGVNGLSDAIVLLMQMVPGDSPTCIFQEVRRMASGRLQEARRKLSPGSDSASSSGLSGFAGFSSNSVSIHGAGSFLVLEYSGPSDKKDCIYLLANDVCFCTAALLYNLGIAHWWLACSARAPREWHAATCLSVLGLARSVLCGLTHGIPDLWFQKRVLLVHLQVVATVQGVLYTMGHVQEAAAELGHLQSMQQSWVHLESLCGEIEERQVAAGAA